jgi:predicted RNA binding protein YcfA (HicA-like mRNA interferase family)
MWRAVMGRMASIVAARMIKALKRLGWVLDHSTGSHHYMSGPSGRRLSIPVHKGRTLKQGTARQILKDAGVAEDEFFDAY